MRPAQAARIDYGADAPCRGGQPDVTATDPSPVLTAERPPRIRRIGLQSPITQESNRYAEHASDLVSPSGPDPAGACQIDPGRVWCRIEAHERPFP